MLKYTQFTITLTIYYAMLLFSLMIIIYNFRYNIHTIHTIRVSYSRGVGIPLLIEPPDLRPNVFQHHLSYKPSRASEATLDISWIFQIPHKQ